MTAATPASETSPTGADRNSSTPDPALRGPRAWIDLGAVCANWRAFQKLAPLAETGAVVKADAYGFGAAPVAAALAGAGCRTFFCATPAEALSVRRGLGGRQGDGAVIYALNGPDPGAAAALRDAAIRPCLNSREQIAVWRDIGPDAPFALHIDTGMNRLGVDPGDLSEARAALPGPPALVMSHLACASDRAHPMNADQRAAFVDAAALFPQAQRSLAASAGAQLGPDFAFDLIRPGVGLYGWHGMDDEGLGLNCAVRVEAPVLQVRTAPAGTPFGYGASVRAARETRAATIACGYADGFLRSASGKGYAAFGGKRSPILGRVSMDLIILDVTEAGPVAAGDWAELVGPSLPVAEVAAAAGTLAYEVFTTLVGTSARIYGGEPA